MHKKCAARAARLYFLIQPMISLICGVVNDVAVVKNSSKRKHKRKLVKKVASRYKMNNLVSFEFMNTASTSNVPHPGEKNGKTQKINK